MAKKAMGFLECAGMGAALYAMNKACQATDITIAGIDTINPKDTSAFIPLTVQVKFKGNVSDVQEAVQVAKQAALTLNQPNEVQTAVIEYPYEGTDQLGAISKIKLTENKHK